MKTIFLILTILISSFAHAEQRIIDDFSTGSVDNDIYYNPPRTTNLDQFGSSIIRNKRIIEVVINETDDNQGVQVTVKNNKLIASFGYNATGTIRLNYGGAGTPDLNPMNLNFSDHSKLVVSFEAKSSVNGFNVTLYTNTRRAYWSKLVDASEGAFDITIPFEELTITHTDFNLAQIDYIVFQFDSRNGIGNNFSINEIRVE